MQVKHSILRLQTLIFLKKIEFHGYFLKIIHIYTKNLGEIHLPLTPPTSWVPPSYIWAPFNDPFY